MASYGWGAPSNNELFEPQKKVPSPKSTSDGDLDLVSYANKLQEDAALNSLSSMSDDDLLKAYEQAKVRESSLSAMSDEELLKAYEDAKVREASSAPAPEAQPPMGALEYLRKSAESKGVRFDSDSPNWKQNLDATLMAFTPFFDKAMRISRSNEIGDLVKMAKGDFDVNDPSIRERYHDSLIPYYSGMESLEDAKKHIQEMALRQAVARSEQLQGVQNEISERGTTTMGTIFGKGSEIVGQAGEMLVPGGLLTKFAVGAGSEAAARYAEHANGKISYDENGNPVVLDGDSTGQSAKEALIGGGVQSGIELLGGKVLGKVWGATGGKLIGKAAGTAVGQKVAENSIVKGVGKITNWLKAPLEITGWAGMPGEIGEEFMQGATDAYFGLNTTDAEERGTTAGGRFKEFAGDFFKGENLADLAESMLLMQAIGGGSAYLQKRHTNKQLNKMITEEIGGVSENILNKLSPEEKARIIEAHYQGLSAEEAADIINKGAGALDKFMIEKQTEATKSANGRAMLAEMNPEAADAIRAARREGKDISRKMIRDLGLSEKVLGDVESRNKFGDALLEDGRARAAKNLSKMDSQQKMALGETIAHFVDANDKDIKKKVYDQIASEITDASVLDDPYQREQLVMKAVDAVYQKEGFGIKVPDISTKEVVNETRTNETPAQPEQAQSVTPPAGEAARPLEAGKAQTKVGGAVETAEKPAEAVKTKVEPTKKAKTPKEDAKKVASVVNSFVAVKKDARDNLKKPYHDKSSGMLVATDGSMMIATKHGYDPDIDNDGESYPNWQHVVPDYSKGEYRGEAVEAIDVDVDSAIAATKRVLGLSRKLGSKDPIVRIGKRSFAFNASKLQKVLTAMKASGITTLEIADAKSPLMAKNKNTTVLLMPLRNADKLEGLEVRLEDGKLIKAPSVEDRRNTEKSKSEFYQSAIKSENTLAEKTNYYKGILEAQKKGNIDPKALYEKLSNKDSSWDSLSKENQDIFADWVATKDKDVLRDKIARYIWKISPKNAKETSPWNLLEKTNKNLSTYDELDAWLKEGQEVKPEKTPSKKTKTEQNVSKTEVADKKTAREAEKAEAKVESKSEAVPSITPAEAMKKLGTLGAADVDTLTKAMHREERLGHTERANMIRVLRDYKRGVGTNTNPQSDETSGGKYRASVEAAKPLDDPAFIAWAKKRGVAPTTQKRNEYDKAMADTLKNRLSRWIKGVSVEWVNFIAPEEGGDLRAAKKRSRAGTVNQRVRKSERGAFRSELTKILANYAHNNNGAVPKASGLFTSDAYYIFDIIDGAPVNIHRMALNESNREKILAFDKKYKREIYRGARSAAGWADWLKTEHVGVLSGDNGVIGNKGADGSLLDASGSREGGGLSLERIGNEENLGGEEDSGATAEIRLLHDGERIVGSYNRTTGEVKLAKGASVETVLHELGWHAARHWAEVNADSDPKAKTLLEQMKKYAETAPKEIKDAVRDVYGDLDADTLLDEIGAARFTKDQSGKIAEALATKEGSAWYQKVWNKVVDFFKNFLTKIGYNRVDLDGVENMSPEVFGDFLADVMMSGKQLGERTAFSMEAPKGLAAKWTNNLSDYKAPIAELEKRTTGSSNNIYYLARTLEGQAQRGKNRAERAIKRVEKILGEDISPELLAQYMQLKAYEERNAKIERRNGKADASGMTPEDARAIEKTIKDSGVDEAIFEETAQILWDLQKEGLQARVDAGLLDQETANKWMTDEPHHIPWKDAVDPDSGEYVGRRMGASEFDTAEGRKTAASGDPITWMLQEYQDAMTRAAQNRLRSAIANLTRLNGNVGTIYDGIQTDSKGKRSFIKYPRGGGRAKVLSIPEGVKIESTVKNDGGMKNVLTFKEGGETKYLVLNGTLGEAVAGAVTGRTLARPPAWISWTMRGYAATATSLSPAFAVRNITADNFDIHNNLVAKYGWVKGEKMFAKIVKEQFLMTKQLGSYIKNGDFKLDKDGKITDFQKLVETYEDAGGLIGGMATEGYDATVKKIQADFRAGRNKARSIGKSVATYWTMMQKMSELAPRLAVFKAAMESGMSAKEAAMLSREITVDFNKKGEKTPWFNTLFMFSNSALGANLTQVKHLATKGGLKLAGGLVMYGFAEGLLEALMNGDDDEREKEGLASGEDINEYTRQNSLYIRRGDKVFRVNIHMGPFAYAKYFGNVMARTFSGMISPEKAAKELGLTAAEVAASFTGLGNVSGDALVQTAVPTVLQPFVQMATNKDYAGRAVYRTKFTASKPDSAHGRKSTPEFYHQVASFLNEITGGNEARKGWIDVAPETVKMLTEMVGKNFARDIMETSEVGYKLLSGNAKDLDVRNVPFAGDVVRKQEGNDNRFYENYNRYRDDKYELKNNSELKGDERRAFLKEHPWLYSAGKPGVTRIDNIVKRIEKLRDVEESDRATEERKAEAKATRRKLQARVIEIMTKK